MPFLKLALLLQPNRQLSCKFEHQQITTAKMRSVLLEFHRKTPKNSFFRRFLAQNVIFADQSCLIYFWHTFCYQMGSYPVSLSILGSIQQNCEAFFWSFKRKPQKTRFSTFFGPKRSFLRSKVAFFYYWHNFCNQMSSYPVSLSIIGPYSKIAKGFPGVLSENLKKPVFSTFFGPKQNFFLIRFAFFIIRTPFTAK